MDAVDIQTAVAGGRPSDGQAGGEEFWRRARRERILRAAAGVFGTSTFASASMEEIARAAQVGKPTLYRYFPSKDALFTAVFERALDDLETRLDRSLGLDLGAEARVERIVGEMIPTFRQHLVSLRFVEGKAATADRSNRRIFRERRTRIGGYLARALEQAAVSGEIRQVDGSRVAQLVIGMLWSGAATMSGSDDDLRREIVGLLLQGLLPREAPPEPETVWRSKREPSDAFETNDAEVLP